MKLFVYLAFSLIRAYDLVVHLLSDLVSSTNSYKLVQDKEARLATDLSLAQAQLFPIRKENARLARENHDLHNDSIRLNDEIRNSIEDNGRQAQKLQEEIQDLMFLCEAQQEQLRSKSEAMDKLRYVSGPVVILFHRVVHIYLVLRLCIVCKKTLS